MIYKPNKALDINTELEVLMKRERVKKIDVANLLGVTKQSIGNTFKNPINMLSKIHTIADILGYDVEINFIKRDNEED